MFDALDLRLIKRRYMNNQSRSMLIALITVISLGGCGGGGSGGSRTLESPPQTTQLSTNQPPAAVISGEASQPLVGATLSGADSYDPDDDQLSYQWRLTAAAESTEVSLSGSDSAEVTIFAGNPGTYQIELQVYDGELYSSAAQFSVELVNSAPVASAGPDQFTPVGSWMQLDGSRSIDPDGQALIYRWEVSGPNAEPVSLDDPSAVNPEFYVAQAGNYRATLVVNDGVDDSLPDYQSINTENQLPEAVARAEYSEFQVGSVIMLDASESYDADGNPLTYTWLMTQRPAGSQVELTMSEGPTTSFMVDVAEPGSFYYVELIVNDGYQDSVNVEVLKISAARDSSGDPDRRINARQTGNGVLFSTVLSGGLPANTRMQWSLLYRPQNSVATLANSNSLNAMLDPDVPGVYVVQLRLDQNGETTLVTSKWIEEN